MLKVKRFNSDKNSLHANLMHNVHFHLGQKFSLVGHAFICSGLCFLAICSKVPLLVFGLALLATFSTSSLIYLMTKECSCRRKLMLAPVRFNKSGKKIALLVLPPVLAALISTIVFSPWVYGIVWIFAGLWMMLWSDKLGKWSRFTIVNDPKELDHLICDELSTESAIDLISVHLQLEQHDKADELSRRLVEEIDRNQDQD